jgi:hypothetical protein
MSHLSSRTAAGCSKPSSARSSARWSAPGSKQLGRVGRYSGLRAATQVSTRTDGGSLLSGPGRPREAPAAAFAAPEPARRCVRAPGAQSGFRGSARELKTLLPPPSDAEVAVLLATHDCRVSAPGLCLLDTVPALETRPWRSQRSVRNVGQIHHRVELGDPPGDDPVEPCLCGPRLGVELALPQHLRVGRSRQRAVDRAGERLHLFPEPGVLAIAEPSERPGQLGVAKLPQLIERPPRLVDRGPLRGSILAEHSAEISELLHHVVGAPENTVDPRRQLTHFERGIALGHRSVSRLGAGSARRERR